MVLVAALTARITFPPSPVAGLGAVLLPVAAIGTAAAWADGCSPRRAAPLAVKFVVTYPLDAPWSANPPTDDRAK